MEAVAQDGEQPRFKVGVWLEAIKVCPGSQEGRLHKVIASDSIVGQRQSEHSQVREKGEYLVAQMLGAAAYASLVKEGELLRVWYALDMAQPPQPMSCMPVAILDLRRRRAVFASGDCHGIAPPRSQPNHTPEGARQPANSAKQGTGPIDP